ncbi:WD40-repeat-containing domain protein [Chiua virens]|nr:WD40-repeat-containing domain protein [Chiua virens]
MAELSAYEQEREANIARNRALLEQLELKDAAASLGVPAKQKPPPKPKAKPCPSRQASQARIDRGSATATECTPTQRRKRLAESETRVKEEEKERIEAEEQARLAKRPRAENLDLAVLTSAEDLDDAEMSALRGSLQAITNKVIPRGIAAVDAWVYEGDERGDGEARELKKKLGKMTIVSRAKVTQDRIYSAMYHPEPTKDLYFSETSMGNWEFGMHELRQRRIDPIDSHSLYTTSYDCTIRQFSFVSGVSRQIYSSDALITSLDLIPSGHEMWISDAAGGVTHMDLREGPSNARWYQLSNQKIGNSVSKNMGHSKTGIQNFIETKHGSGSLRGENAHGKSVTSAYWDPRGRSIVSTCYDDTLRIWELDAGKYDAFPVFPAFAPFSRVKHNCQTGKWVTLLRAIWTPNPDVYPHFTIGSMDHSLHIYSCKGELVAKLSDRERPVTCSHPSIVERCATGNASGRCVLWAPSDDE